MALIYIVRHGKAAASFTDDLDPGLDDLGREQAVIACDTLEDKLPLRLLTSPLKRAQETSVPLAESTGQTLTIESRLAEIPSPGLSLEDRGAWLQAIMASKWSEQTEALIEWRANIKACLAGITEDTVIFSHFVAINAAVGIAEGSDQALLFRPDNGSITIIENSASGLTLIERGREAITHVN